LDKWTKLLQEGNFEAGRGRPLQSIGTLCRELCVNCWTDRDAVWAVDSGEPKEPCFRWGVHWHHLANTTEPSVCGV